ncbi:MAG: hypothetical protein AUI14_26310 [Actinobacteria bacterium 13_2_20CM_2_71_6]|nr:MAG: hypothetical protein AUI14_26310 [Actinobacteria bacterium 13_2_20CM_2_71_6]
MIRSYSGAWCPTCGGHAAESTAHEERRTVSVLFADMVGFTALASDLDPEDVRALQRGYFRAVRQVVHRWDGVVEKYAGDAVLAVFGALRCDEHDAYRAVRAGLQVHEALRGRRFPPGLPVRAKVGIATGEALVDLAGVCDGGQALVSGDVVNVASRLQGHAAAGTVVVSAATRRATGSLIRYEDLPRTAVAGKPEPLEIFRAAGMEHRRPADDAAPFVGRDAELATLTGRLTRAFSGRVAQLVSVAGPAGTGKSRLVREAADRLPVTTLVGHCVPGGDGRYEPLAQMVRGFAGIRDGDDEPTVRRLLGAALAGLVGADELPDLVAVLPGVLGGQLAPREAERVWRRLLITAASRSPLLVVIEDLQWAAPALARFVRDFVTSAPAVPLGIVVTRRPESTEVTAGLPADRAGSVTLPPLGTGETARLLRHLLDRAGRSPMLAGRLLPVVSGNPLYAREYVNLLTGPGSPGAELPVPELLRAIVSARIDRLDPADRAALQAAAVFRLRRAGGPAGGLRPAHPRHAGGLPAPFGRVVERAVRLCGTRTPL